MLQKKLCLVVTFDATAAAMAAEKYCLERDVPGRLIPVPREITAGCGLAWKAEVDQEEAVTAFAGGKSPYLIAGPQAVPPVRTAGVPFTVEAVPGFDGVLGV